MAWQRLCARCCALSADAVRAGTIIKLNLGGDNSTDIAYDGSTCRLSTTSARESGNQDTGVDFLDILSPLADIPSPQASFSLDGLPSSGLATVTNGLVIQNFTGGTLKLYGPVRLLTCFWSGTSCERPLPARSEPPATGALFTTSFAQ